MLRLAVGVVGVTVDRIDPSRGSGLDHSCGFAMHRTLAARWRPPSAARAGTRHHSGEVILPDLFAAVNPWQPWLELRPDLEPLVDRLEPPRRELVTRRYGLDGDRPVTMVELARCTERASSTVAGAIERAERQLRVLARTKLTADS